MYRRALLRPKRAVEWSAHRKKPVPELQAQPYRPPPPEPPESNTPTESADNEAMVRSRRPGPAPGTKGLKRKAESELSTHPQSIRRRERETNMTDIEKRINNAKNADRAAVFWRIRELRKSNEYQTSSSQEAKNAMENDMRQKILHKRYVS